MFGGNSKASSVQALEAELPIRRRAVLPSFKEIYRQYFELVWASARRFGVAPEAIDDVVQEVFIVVHARLHTLEHPEALRSWIYGVVRRTVSTYHRAARAQKDASETRDDVEGVSASPTPLEQTETNAELQLLASLLERMDCPKREIFVLVELDDLSVPDAAKTLEIPLNTAYSRLRAARQAFEAMLERHEAHSKST